MKNLNDVEARLRELQVTSQRGHLYLRGLDRLGMHDSLTEDVLRASIKNVESEYEKLVQLLGECGSFTYSEILQIISEDETALIKPSDSPEERQPIVWWRETAEKGAVGKDAELHYIGAIVTVLRQKLVSAYNDMTDVITDCGRKSHKPFDNLRHKEKLLRDETGRRILERLVPPPKLKFPNLQDKPEQITTHDFGSGI